MTKQELSEKLAKAYGISDFKYANGWLIVDTARIMELAFEHGVCADPCLRDNAYAVYSDAKGDDVEIAEPWRKHPTKKDAILWAVGLALLKKAGV